MSARKKLPMGWRWAKLSEIVDIDNQSIRPSAGTAYRYVGLENIESGVGDFTDIPEVDGHAIESGKYRFSQGHILYGKLRPYLNKVALPEFDGVCSTDILPLSPKINSAKEFLFFWLRSAGFVDYATRNATGTKMPRLGPDKLLSAEIPLPPLAVQERIVEVLQQADAIRRKRAEARRLADQILPAAFYGLFGDVDPISTEFDVVRLEEVADIRSGVTKGRNLEGKETVEVPYLRVANVQDGFLDVTEIKEITVLPTDVQKYHLEDGDILMTEGGDPDKLGRGCIWREQVKGCIHQNHIFRVRPDKTCLFPEFLAALLRTFYAKAYFLRAAKRTSNLASINSTQVKAFSFPLPPMEMQRKFLLRVEQWDKAIGQSTDALHLAERTFTVLLSRAFTGKLTAEWEAANADWIAERQTFYERLPQLVLLSLLLERQERAGRNAVTLITALMKYAFLAQMEGELHRRLYYFVPYHYGPCAMELYDDLKALAGDGLITIENNTEEGKTRITLSDPALAAALLEQEASKDDARLAALEKAGEDTETLADPAMSHLLKRRAETLEILRADAATILDTYGDLDHSALLKTVYEKYPAYAKNSRIRKARKSSSGK